MSDLQFEFQALKSSTYLRLLSINKIIRDKRDKIDKETLNYYKCKRKETDQLLSHIKKLDKNDVATFNKLKEVYMTFDIK